MNRMEDILKIIVLITNLWNNFNHFGRPILIHNENPLIEFEETRQNIG